MRLIDTHSHLYADAFSEDMQEVISRMQDNHVDTCMLPNIDMDSIDAMHKLALADPGLFYPMMGLHPCSVKEDYRTVLDKMEENINNKRINYIGIGETGLDYYWDITFKNQQKASLEIHIEWAKRFDLPIILHCRDSFDDVYSLIAKNNDEKLTGVFHCFTGTIDDALKVKELGGFYLGIGGVLTFKNSGLDKTVMELDINDMVLETDSPYLAPVPFRGKRNESSYLDRIANKLAEIKSLSIKEIADITSANAEKLFSMNHRES